MRLFAAKRSGKGKWILAHAARVISTSKFPVAIFVVQWLVVYVGALAGLDVVPVSRSLSQFTKHAPSGSFFASMFRWDSVSYLAIARDGYSFNGNFHQQQDIAFFPGYPLFLRLVHLLTESWSYASVELPNVALALVSIVVFYRLSQRFCAEGEARFVTALFALYPGNMFFYSAYPAALASFLVILSVSYFASGRMTTGAMYAGLCTAVSPFSAFFSFGLFVSEVRRVQYLGLTTMAAVKTFWRFLGFGLLSLSGLLGFLVFQEIMYRNPFVFDRILGAWHYHLAFRDHLDYFLKVSWFGINGSRFSSLWRMMAWQPYDKAKTYANLIGAINAFSLAEIILGSVFIIKYSRTLAAYGVLVVLVWAWYLGCYYGLYSTARIVSIGCPVVIGLSAIYRKSPYIALAVLMISGVLLAVSSALFVARYPVV